MKFSNYTIFVNNYPSEDECLLFNTRTQAMVKINADIKDIIENYYLPENFAIRLEHMDDIEQMYEMGILVEDDHADFEKLKTFFYNIKHTIQNKSFGVTILTTDECNFNCIYCFEKESQQNVKMTPAIADSAIHWIKEEIKTLDAKELCLTFYGGEPMLNMKVLKYLASYFHDWCRRQGMAFKFMLQTNGYLMSSEVIDELVAIGLREVRISLDGLASVHDAKRPLKNGKGTFDKIMNNIMDCIDRIKISISTSYQEDNIGDIEELLDYFDRIGILHKLGEFIFSPIHPSLGPKSNPEIFQHISCLGSYDDDVMISATKKIRNLMERKHLLVRSVIAISTCPLITENSPVTIDQKGDIYKCNSMLGYPQYAVGNVKEHGFNCKNNEFLNLDAWEKCPPDCLYLPICSGGCRFMAFLENKNFDDPICKKKYLDELSQDFVKKEYEKLTK